MNAYIELYEQLSVDTSFLWLLRSQAVNQPNFNGEDLAALDQRISARFEALVTHPNVSWAFCLEALQHLQTDDVFTATLLAFHSLDADKIKIVVDAGLTNDQTFKGIVSAMAWLPDDLIQVWIKKFLASPDLNHKYLAIAVCSARREDPRDFLTAILQREDCRAHEQLYARALRLVGEIKRVDLMPAVNRAMQSDNINIIFWSNWAAALLGKKNAVQALYPFVLHNNPHRLRAIYLSIQTLPLDVAYAWICLLAKDADNIRLTIMATGLLGDAQSVNWLIEQMRTPAISRLAGEAFSWITGIDLNTQKLSQEPPPNFDDAADTMDTPAALDYEDRLPWPNVHKIAAFWQMHQSIYLPKQRYFMGQLISLDHLKAVYGSGNQRQRHAAALTLALLQPAHFLLHHEAKELTTQ